MNMTSKLAVLLAAGIVAIGCAAPQSQELKQAQQSYSAAKDDPSITHNASVTLHEAKQALDRAQGADSEEEQKHHAYLAQKKIDLARIQADQLQTRQEVEALQAEQDRFLLSLRREQAEQARRQAEQSQQELQAYRAQEREREMSRAQQETQEAQQETQQAQTELQQLRQEMSDLEAKQTETGYLLTLSDVVFEFGKAELKSGAERGIGRLTEFLKSHPDRKILVEGFTDSVGNEQFNQRLSERRADAVAQVLQAEGISPDRITTRGLGESYPVASNDTDAGRQQNRRVEITILNPQIRPEDSGRSNGRT